MCSYLSGAFRKRFGADKHLYRFLDQVFGICPDNKDLYKLALLHSSACITVSDNKVLNNERLEYLGDAVLETIISDWLFIEFPNANEGELTQMRSKLVSRSMLNDLAMKIGLDKFVVTHNIMQNIPKSIYGNAFEAIVGALYLDKGYNKTNRIIIRKIFERYIDLDDIDSIETDYKSRLLEWCQKSKVYLTFRTRSCKDDIPTANFRSAAIIDNMEVAYGIGNTKKEAEQNAAYTLSKIMSDKVGDNFLEKLDKLGN